MASGPGTWRWGIAGTGGIAASFTRDLALVPGAEVVAVGSRSSSTAEAFAATHGIARAHGSYDALASDDGVDIVYVAGRTPVTSTSRCCSSTPAVTCCARSRSGCRQARCAR